MSAGVTRCVVDGRPCPHSVCSTELCGRHEFAPVDRAIRAQAHRAREFAEKIIKAQLGPKRGAS